MTATGPRSRSPDRASTASRSGPVRTPSRPGAATWPPGSGGPGRLDRLLIGATLAVGRRGTARPGAIGGRWRSTAEARPGGTDRLDRVLDISALRREQRGKLPGERTASRPPFGDRQLARLLRRARPVGRPPSRPDDLRSPRRSTGCSPSPSGPASAPGTSCSPGRRHPTPAATAPWPTSSGSLPYVAAWASTSSTCRRSTRSAGRTARAATTDRAAEPGDPGSPWAIGVGRGRPHRASTPSSAPSTTSARSSPPPPRDGIEVALDLAFQCSPDHPWVARAPGVVPPAPRRHDPVRREPAEALPGHLPARLRDRRTGPALWEALRDVVAFWIDQGVRIFRVDNPHTKPFAFWEWLIADVQGASTPTLIFLAEAFTRPKVMHDWPRSASPSPTPTSPGATRSGSSRATSPS